ncbi:hypothetical protein ABL78_1688 [Leptomonas seymouri]|uniref:Thioredoxin-like fold domain-containing protein n=1 Tax=Leptomonas seymouri TaxID=5684 RepID=A0A0N1IM13_LEPSE|nr:hypothetical protein ABL78_1688 [Leptomonas seymouri]|eukprot:KPI89195.1 hypothetical protein ABL78_1688 [Leptomonas seymouri]
MKHFLHFPSHGAGPDAPTSNGPVCTAFFHKTWETARSKLKQLKPFQRQIAIAAASVAGLVAAYKTASYVHTLVQRRRRQKLLLKCQQDAGLYIFILPRSPWSPSLSPRCTRVEAYLRANGIPYKAIETVDPTGSPSGELPFIVFKHARVDQLPRIFEFLGTEFGVTMDDALTREERAIGAALRRTLEYNMERFLYRTAFVDHPTLAISQIARALHISRLRARLAVRRYATMLREQLAITAYGALVSEQYESEFLLDCEALEAQIGDKRFLFSNSELTSYDCAVYALLVPFAYMGKYTALSTAYMAVADSVVLMRYVARISKRLFADVAAQFDAADMSFETSPASSPLPVESGASAADSEELHRDLEVPDEEATQPEETQTKAGRPSVQPETASSRPPTSAAAAASKHPKGSPQKAGRAKKVLPNSPPKKVKSAGASPKKL